MGSTTAVPKAETIVTALVKIYHVFLIDTPTVWRRLGVLHAANSLLDVYFTDSAK